MNLIRDSVIIFGLVLIIGPGILIICAAFVRWLDRRFGLFVRGSKVLLADTQEWWDKERVAFEEAWKKEHPEIMESALMRNEFNSTYVGGILAQGYHYSFIEDAWYGWRLRAKQDNYGS